MYINVHIVQLKGEDISFYLGGIVHLKSTKYHVLIENIFARRI